jgi:hypothetical protein
MTRVGMPPSRGQDVAGRRRRGAAGACNARQVFPPGGKIRPDASVWLVRPPNFPLSRRRPGPGSAEASPRAASRASLAQERVGVSLSGAYKPDPEPGRIYKFRFKARLRLAARRSSRARRQPADGASPRRRGPQGRSPPATPDACRTRARDRARRRRPPGEDEPIVLGPLPTLARSPSRCRHPRARWR